MKYFVCIDNSDYEASLSFAKIYPVLPEKSSDRGLLRVIDESGEDYLYPPERFCAIDIPQPLAEKLYTSAP